MDNAKSFIMGRDTGFYVTDQCEKEIKKEAGAWLFDQLKIKLKNLAVGKGEPEGYGFPGYTGPRH